ncbi:MAG: trehalose-6-phosphate synthase [Anaerolineales bacterium]|nr:trehalose-6-phosphate synthase [Anaerolineales bacterium]
MDNPTAQRTSTILNGRSVIIASNRGPVTFLTDADGHEILQRGSGGLITALTGFVQHMDAAWIACAQTNEDSACGTCAVPLVGESSTIDVHFLTPDPEAYFGYYNVISNPLLWFIQHSMWDIPRQPVIDSKTWEAWYGGYAAVNRMFGEAIIEHVQASSQPPIVMLQDYHLYLAARTLRSRLPRGKRPVILHFIHIPWPGPEYWRILPPEMRHAILDGLCAVDILGFQTREDKLNFLRTCQNLLPRSHSNYKHDRVWYRNHATHVREFPISIDVDSIRRLSRRPETTTYRDRILETADNRKLILRIDRIEPSKNIIRGFKAYQELLDLHPEHRNRVQFLALLVPSRMDIIEYQTYLDEIMAVVGKINATYSTSDWEPIRLLIGEDYQRAVAAMQVYDVLLVNAIADGMNLVAKEGPVLNQRDGVLILSERAGAREQLEPGAMIISPCDIYATSEAIHQALNMNPGDKKERADLLRWLIEKDDIHNWLDKQLESIAELGL